jgi:apolipoprotein N-acyltransferase
MVLALASVGIVLASEEALSGVFLVFLGLPWSIVATAAIDAVAPAAFDIPIVGLVVGLSCAGINAGLLYLLTRLIARRGTSEPNRG